MVQGPSPPSPETLCRFQPVGRIDSPRLRFCVCLLRAAAMMNTSRVIHTTEIDYLTVLEARKPRSRCQRGWFLLEAAGENLFHAFLLVSGNLLAISGSRRVGHDPISAFSFTWPSPCVHVSVPKFVLFIRHNSYWIRSPPYSSMTSS